MGMLLATPAPNLSLIRSTAVQLKSKIHFMNDENAFESEGLRRIGKNVLLQGSKESC